MLITGDFSAINDQIVIQLDPVYSVLSFNFFTDTVTGENPPLKELQKEFRYSRNGGATWSVWQTLTDPALVTLDTSDTLSPWSIEVRYTRIGTDGTGIISWDWFYLDITVDTTAVTTFCPAIFSSQNLFCDLDTTNATLLQLCSNLLDKLIKYGVIPKYISDESGERTVDYIHYWKTICCWFSLHFIFAKQFAEIYTSKDLLYEFLLQRGVFLCDRADLATLQGLANEYYSNMWRRGTLNAITEIKRIICSGVDDEFIFAVVPKFQGGWVLNNASPLYRGCAGIQTLQEMVETKSLSVEAKTNYHLINSAGISIAADVDNDGNSINVFHISGVTADTGIEQTGSDESLTYVVDTRLPYDISFYVKQEVLGAILTFGAKCYDSSGAEILQPFEDIVTGVQTNYFFQTADVIDRIDKYIQIRGTVHKGGEPLKSLADGTLKFGYGKNVRFRTGLGIVRMYPIIKIENGLSVPGNSTKLYGIRSHLSSNEFALGFIGLSNMILGYYKNQSGDLSDVEVKDRISRYMIPANAILKQTILP